METRHFINTLCKQKFKTFFLRILTGKSTVEYNSAYTEGTNMGISVVGISNQLFIGGS